ncbi:response regulator transcription factor [Lacibacter sp. MH-610]|uniref:response regulator n=1 Tax=Lacibacter sp. MH-610 TaxID=3020883 RepID=UPI003891E9DF
MKENTTILIVEDELITAAAIEELLLEEDYQIIGVAADGTTALELCRQAAEPPALILCDINIKGSMDGITLAGQLKQQYQSEIIFLTAYTDTKTLEAAFVQEPVMYVVKPYNDRQLLAAVQMAFHKIYQKEKSAPSVKLTLTTREKQIATLVAQGLSSKQIAQQLYISEETVKTHRRRMMQKNDISSFSQLTYLLSREG